MVRSSLTWYPGTQKVGLILIGNKMQKDLVRMKELIPRTYRELKCLIGPFDVWTSPLHHDSYFMSQSTERNGMADSKRKLE